MRDPRRPPRVDDDAATTMDGVRTDRDGMKSFVRVVVSVFRRAHRAATRERIARAIVGGKPYEEGNPEGGARRGDEETRPTIKRVFRVK